MKYTITITKEDYEFILLAVDAYVASLRQKIADQATIGLLTKSEDKPAIEPSKSAPYGYKKDGTPRRPPGRKPLRRKA